MIGSGIRVNGENYTVIGVMPHAENFPVGCDVWLPLAYSAKEWGARDNHSLSVLARLKSGVSVTQAQADMTAVTAQLARAYPQTNEGYGAKVKTLRDEFSDDITNAFLFTLELTVFFVLLIACTNIANLQLSRSSSREKEIAIRMALGAGRWQILRQLLTENMIIGLAGGVFGILLAWWGVYLIKAYSPADWVRNAPGWEYVGINKVTLTFTLVVAVLTGIIVGLAPALQLSKPNLTESLKEGSLGAGTGRGRLRLRKALVVAEVALALTLLVAPV